MSENPLFLSALNSPISPPLTSILRTQHGLSGNRRHIDVAVFALKLKEKVVRKFLLNFIAYKFHNYTLLHLGEYTSIMVC
jgi:hypothetical protein